MQTDHPTGQGPAERMVRPPRKADIARLEGVLHDWRMQEANLASHGLAVVPGSMRAKRIKDAAALQKALAYLRAHIDGWKRPNVEVTGTARRAGSGGLPG